MFSHVMGRDHEDEYPESHHQKPSPVTRAKHIHLFCVQVHMRVRDRKREREGEIVHTCVCIISTCVSSDTTKKQFY